MKKKKSHFCFEMHCEHCTSKKYTKANNAEVFSPYCYDPLQQMCLLAPLLKVDFHILFSPVFCVFYFLCSVHLWSTANIQQTGTAGLANSHSLFEFIGSIPLDLQLIVHHWESRDTLSSREQIDPKRGGLHARLKAHACRPPQPNLLMASVRSLVNELDEEPWLQHWTHGTHGTKRMLCSNFHWDLAFRQSPGMCRSDAARPHFGHSDQISMFLYPAYRQRLK